MTPAHPACRALPARCRANLRHKSARISAAHQIVFPPATRKSSRPPPDTAARPIANEFVPTCNRPAARTPCLRRLFRTHQSRAESRAAHHLLFVQTPRALSRCTPAPLASRKRSLAHSRPDAPPNTDAPATPVAADARIADDQSPEHPRFVVKRECYLLPKKSAIYIRSSGTAFQSGPTPKFSQI